ncbi:MAG TPA: hypothetical protein VK177_10325, partial [Flavobacteriales bacterium]|nr:hypothetical protein [Flavobacteriales bacterium]
MQNEDYFKSYRDYFWQWEENGEVLAIPYGKTIAYRNLVEQVLERLQPNGIPYFGSLLLAAIATNHSGAESLSGIHKKMAEQFRTVQQENAHENFPERIMEAFTFLHKIANLADEYKTGDKKILLLQAVFEKAHNLIAPASAKSILETFRTNMPPHIFSGQFGF